MGEPKYDEVELAELREEKRSAEAARENWAQRWLLSLAVANAGALLAAASVMLDPSKRTWMVVAPAWLFLTGLAIAGIIPAVAVARYDNLAQVRWSETRANPFRIRHNGKELTEQEYRTEVSGKVELFDRFTAILAALSALCFLAGAISGLALLSSATLRGVPIDRPIVAPPVPAAAAMPAGSSQQQG